MLDNNNRIICFGKSPKVTDVYIQTTKASNVGIGGEEEIRRHEKDSVQSSIALLSILGEGSFTCDSLLGFYVVLGGGVVFPFSCLGLRTEDVTPF